MNTEVITLLLAFPDLIRPTDIVLLKDGSENFGFLRSIYNSAELAKKYVKKAYEVYLYEY